MTSMEDQFETACKDGTIPGAILIASNRSGRLLAQLAEFSRLSTPQALFTMPARWVSALSRPWNRLKWTA